ncbi:hypothetical protein LWI28_015969 [Acer negundo]|uniref:Uncharacterized protein n=1 Tax=Acer negundo TaxID=4023 RepID=A0AAD5J1D6_ACENE|nr:hypothetical protein LWI28_015969 [Acer negundo]
MGVVQPVDHLIVAGTAEPSDLNIEGTKKSILLAAPLVPSSLPSASPTANVGISLGSSRSTDTPLLIPTKSQPSLPDTFSTPPTTRSPLSEIAARASRLLIDLLLGKIIEVITSASESPNQQDGKTQVTEGLTEAMIELTGGGEVPATPKVQGT